MSDIANRVDRAEAAKRIERAEKLLQKGKTADALEEYLQVLAGDPGNDTVRQMSADLSLSLQRLPDAVRLLGELFDHQVEAGDATRASITYKKLARYVNPTWEQKLSFGQLLENSNRKLALETYENAVEELLKQQRKQDSLSLLKRIVVLDASERNLLRLGELSSEVGDGKGAGACFLQLARLAESSGGNAAQWFERAYTEDQANAEIAQAYGKSLLAQEQVGAAIFVLEPLLKDGSASQELHETYAKALFAANRLTEAEPLIWHAFEQNPTRINDISKLIGAFLDAEQDKEAVALARKLEDLQRKRGERRAFVSMMQELASGHRASPEMLEFMSELFNGANREADYCQTLLKLFDLHFGMGNYVKAAECLDRAVEVDAYEPGHQKRMESLRGKIDDSRYKVIASRLSNLNSASSETAHAEEPTLGASALQDLMLQAEILVQYGMRSKAIERLQRIQELFPREEERNPDLQQLYLAAGMMPRYAAAAPSTPAAAAVPAVPASPPAAFAPDTADVSSLTRVAEITRKLYRQNNTDAVLTTAASEVGLNWKVTRCVAAMRKPGMAPSAIKEFCGQGVATGESTALAKVVAAVQDLAITRGTLVLTDAVSAAELAPVREQLAELRITSLLAFPLSEGADHMGVLILTHSGSRAWSSNEILVLKTITDQTVIALNNAGLRRLVRNLSVTDEHSGLLKRASYLDLLMAETRRAVQQATPVSVLLMQFGKASAMLKELGEGGIDHLMRQVGQLFAANIRQNDLAFRYGTTSVAIVLGETAEKEAMLAAEKLRKILAQVKLPDKDEPVRFNAGLAEAVVRQQFDAADIVTEVINRAEQALEQSLAQGPGKIVAVPANLSNAAVA